MATIYKSLKRDNEALAVSVVSVSFSAQCLNFVRQHVFADWLLERVASGDNGKTSNAVSEFGLS